MKKFFGEFKTFITKGNVMDLAVGLIVGGMFTKIVNSLANDILMPFISLMTGKASFEEMFVALDGVKYDSLAMAKEALAPVVAYGNLIQLILDFLITGFCLFLIVKGMNKLKEIDEKKAEILKNTFKAKKGKIETEEQAEEIKETVEESK